ncbi:MAG: helix-turn-helix domain-containing protein [Candidatus Thorarchaeota archaeon]
MTQYLQDSMITDKKRDKLSELDQTTYKRIVTNKNDALVVGALLQIQPATRMEICKLTGIPRTTIYDSLDRLILKRMVVKYSISSRHRGRPKVYYKIP